MANPSPSLIVSHRHIVPTLADLGDDLNFVSLPRRILTVAIPIVAVAACMGTAAMSRWEFAIPLVGVYLFSSYASASHDLVHGSSRFPPWLTNTLLTFIELLGLRSGTAYRLAHLHHHRTFPAPEDIEGHAASQSVSAAIVAGVCMQPRQWLWAYRHYPSHRRRLLAELGLMLVVLVVAAWSWGATPLPLLYLGAVVAGSWSLPLATVFFVHRPNEHDPLRQTRLFRGRLFHILFLGHLYHLEHHLYPSVPHHNWGELARRIDPYLRAAGIRPVDLDDGEESLPEPARVLPTRAGVTRFWLDYWLTFLVFVPVIVVRQARILWRQLVATLATYNRTVVLLHGQLEIIYFNNVRSFLVSVFFGERFQAVRYGDKLVDPGPPFAAERISRHVRGLSEPISAIVVTHAHEEHFANAGHLARQLTVPIVASAAARDAIGNPARLSFMRRTMIGQPRPAPGAWFSDSEATRGSPELVVLASDGHCPGHLSFYDRERKILLLGDSFMHEIFTSPNAEVDSRVWIDTLRRYAALDVRTMVGSHGEVTTIDEDIPDIPWVVVRRDPQQLIARKLAFMQWAAEVVKLGEARGLPYSVIEAALFPWSRTWSWKNFFVDEAARLLSGGEFSRTHLVRSLSTTPDRVPSRFRGRARTPRS